MPVASTDRRRSAARRFLFTSLVVPPVALGFATMLFAAEFQLVVDDATVVTDQPGTHELPFVIRREGDLTDGVRVLVETGQGGGNPASPGEDYAPLPPGTEIVLQPGVAAGVAAVQVQGGGQPQPDKTLLLHLTGAHAFNPSPRLRPGALHARVGGSPASMASADLNGDGHQDVVVGLEGGPEGGAGFALLMNDGAGGFLPATTLSPGGIASLTQVILTTADVNGDGHADIVASGPNASAVTVLAGDGQGGFTLLGSHPVSSGQSGLVVADLDGDGLPDIVTASVGGTVSVLQGTGAGDFGPAVDWDVETAPNALRVADVTGNGHPDIVVVHSIGGQITVLPGNGDGTFSERLTLDTGDGFHPISLALADVTGNGRTDIVAGNSPSSDVPWNESTAGAAGSGLAVFEGLGADQFAAPTYWPVDGGRHVQWIEIADVTGNGHLDILASQPRSVVVLTGDGTGQFSDALRVPAGYGVITLAVTDITGDGHPDVVAAHVGSQDIMVLPGDGMGGVGFPGNHPVGGKPMDLALVDLNGNGYPDIVTVNPGHGFDGFPMAQDLTVLLNDGQGGYAPAVSYDAGIFDPWSINVADLNGDGIGDLVVSGFTGVAVRLGLGDGTFGELTNFEVAEPGGWETPLDTAIADVTGNGHLDIITANSNIERNSITLLAGDGSGGFADPVVFDVPADATQDLNSVILVDATGNGQLDVVTPRAASADVLILQGDGAGGFGAWGALPVDTWPVIVAAGDLSGNGHPDLVTVSHNAHSVSVLLGEGDGNYASAVHYSIHPPQAHANHNAWPWGMTLADVTGDGHLDIVTANTSAHSISVLVNDGTGQFGPPVVFPVGTSPGEVRVADVNGNGHADVVSANRNSDSVTILFSALSRAIIADAEAVGTIISGDPETMPAIAVTPPSLDFGGHAVGQTSAPMTVTIASVGGGDLEIGGITGPQAPFAPAGGSCGTAPFTLPPGSSCTLDYVFEAPSAGPFVSVLTVTSNAGNTDVGFSGEGLTGGPVAGLATELDFGAVAPGQDEQRDLVLTNTGTANLNIEQLITPGAPFSLTGGRAGHSCATVPFSLAPGTACAWTIAFSPPGPGEFTGQLEIISNSATSPDTVILTGAGIAGGPGGDALLIPVGHPIALLLLILSLLVAGGIAVTRVR